MISLNWWIIFAKKTHFWSQLKATQLHTVRFGAGSFHFICLHMSECHRVACIVVAAPGCYQKENTEHIKANFQWCSITAADNMKGRWRWGKLLEQFFCWHQGEIYAQDLWTDKPRKYIIINLPLFGSGWRLNIEYGEKVGQRSHSLPIM